MLCLRICKKLNPTATKMQKNDVIEFILAGLAGCGAGIFTNPLEVIKTRMQLQGELKARGQHAVFYKNSLHAAYAVAKSDGILALQSGLVPGLWYQLVMNGFRLGSYQTFVNLGFTEDRNGNYSFTRRVLAGAIAGVIGTAIGSPLYLVKTHLQSRSAEEIAVGHQHTHTSMSEGFHKIYKQDGITGLFRGLNGAVPRGFVGSATQLASFSSSKDYITRLKIFPETSWGNAICASMISGVVITLFMTPFDVICTRLYNQKVDSKGNGLLYRSVTDCFIKMLKSEGFWGFYKGWGPSFLRLGPHTILSLTFWDRLRVAYNDFRHGA